MGTPDWILSIAYWLHMLATITWIGGLAALGLLVLPAARQTLNTEQFAKLLGRIQKRLDPVAWFSLALLAGTGLLQLSANPNPQGFLAVNTPWGLALFVKHLLFLVMTAISAYLTWGLLPRLRRLALAQGKHQGEEQISTPLNQLQRQEILLLRINLILGVIILALTAVARVS